MNRDAKDRLVLFALLMAFAGLVIEVRYMHRRLIADGQEWRAWIPIVTSGVLCLCSFLGMAKDKVIRNFAFGGFLLGTAAGIVGVWIHTGGDFSALKTYLAADPQEPWQRIPYMAPGAISGLSLIGLIITLPVRKRS